MGYVGGGVGNLGGGQRTHRPVAEPMRLVDAATGQAGDKRVIADLVAEPGHHRGDLGVEHRARDIAKAQHEDLDVLAGGVEHLGHFRVGKQGAEGGQVDAICLGVDHRDLVFAGDLHQAQLRPVGAFTHELGVDGDERFGVHALAERLQRIGRGDQGRRRIVGAGGSGHSGFVHGCVRKAKICAAARRGMVRSGPACHCERSNLRRLRPMGGLPRRCRASQ